MSATERRRSPGGFDAQAWLFPGLLGLWLLLGCCLWAGMHLGRLLDTDQTPIPSPVVLPLAVILGHLQLSTVDIAAAATILVLLLAAAALIALVTVRRRKPNRSVDRAAVHMARGHELARFTKAEVATTAARIAPSSPAVGVYLGTTIAGRTELYADWESGEVDIWGPRTGKTSSRAIPTLLDCPGAAMATTNRRDLVDLTRDPRADAGRVWVFDPQQIIGETPTFYWNPLAHIMSGPQHPAVKAKELAVLFHAATTPPESRSDTFFDPKGKALLGHLLLAAAVDGKTLVQAYRWTNREKDKEPVEILREHGYTAAADFVEGIIGGPDKQRGGIYATAELCLTWMTNPAAVDWVVPVAGRPAFATRDFALTCDTLYLVSREGSGSLAPLTTALAWAMLQDAEETATRLGGRLPIPMVAVLDEAANTAPMPGLPALYSHFGGRSIYLLTILQSWKQGEDAFGARGMHQLWSAATVRVYGGGDAEVGFLDELRRLTGTFRPLQRSSTSSRQGSSSQWSEGSDDILDVADLAALPRGRVLLVPSGARPTLVETQQYKDGPWAGVVEASRLAHDPTARAAAPPPRVNPAPDVPPAGALFRRATP